MARKTNDACCVRQNRVVLAPVAGVKLSVAKSVQPDRSAIKPAATVTRRIRRRGEHGISRKAIAQGMPECSAVPVCSCAFSMHIFAHETAGAACTRHSLLPLFFWRDKVHANLGRSAPREGNVCLSSVIASAAKQSISPRKGKNGLLRFARNDVDKPQRTGCPACAGHDSLCVATAPNWLADPHGEERGHAARLGPRGPPTVIVRRDGPRIHPSSFRPAAISPSPQNALWCPLASHSVKSNT